MRVDNPHDYRKKPPCLYIKDIIVKYIKHGCYLPIPKVIHAEHHDVKGSHSIRYSPQGE